MAFPSGFFLLPISGGWLDLNQLATRRDVIDQDRFLLPCMGLEVALRNQLPRRADLGRQRGIAEIDRPPSIAEDNAYDPKPTSLSNVSADSFPSVSKFAVELVQAMHDHGSLRCSFREAARGPESPETIPARLPPLGPPKRLFDFVRDVAPGDADIVQVALGPACEFPAIAITLPPEMKGLRQPDCLLAGQLLDDSLDIRGDQAC
jgi:hypothetical protein